VTSGEVAASTNSIPDETIFIVLEINNIFLFWLIQCAYCRCYNLPPSSDTSGLYLHFLSAREQLAEVHCKLLI